MRLNLTLELGSDRGAYNENMEKRERENEKERKCLACLIKPQLALTSYDEWQVEEIKTTLKSLSEKEEKHVSFHH